MFRTLNTFKLPSCLAVVQAILCLACLMHRVHTLDGYDARSQETVDWFHLLNQPESKTKDITNINQQGMDEMFKLLSNSKVFEYYYNEGSWLLRLLLDVLSDELRKKSRSKKAIKSRPNEESKIDNDVLRMDERGRKSRKFSKSLSMNDNISKSLSNPEVSSRPLDDIDAVVSKSESNYHDPNYEVMYAANRVKMTSQKLGEKKKRVHRKAPLRHIEGSGAPAKKFKFMVPNIKRKDVLKSSWAAAFKRKHLLRYKKKMLGKGLPYLKRGSRSLVRHAELMKNDNRRLCETKCLAFCARIMSDVLHVAQCDRGQCYCVHFDSDAAEDELLNELN